MPRKYVLGVCFESPFTRIISNLKYKWPLGIQGESAQWPYENAYPRGPSMNEMNAGVHRKKQTNKKKTYLSWFIQNQQKIAKF